jgi:hypothetical protein
MNTARLRRKLSAISFPLSALGCWPLAIGFAGPVAPPESSRPAKILMFSSAIVQMNADKAKRGHGIG